MNRIKEIELEIKSLTEQAKELQKEIDNFELDPYDYEDEFCEHLDDDYIYIGSLSFEKSNVLRECDPIAYRCALLEYVDAYRDDLLERNDELNELKEELEELENQIDELNEELENQIEFEN